jgi:type I restriction enzyme S subunit
VSVPGYESYKDSGVEWLGQVPEHWDVAPIKAVTSCNDEVLTEATPADYEVEYVEISDVQAGQGIKGSTTYSFADAPSRARRRLRDGDVLVSTVRTYLRAIAQVHQPSENLIASTGFAVLRPRTAHSGFLGYAIQSEATINEIIARSVGVSYPAINASDLVRIPVPLPTLAEQITIAAFLDRETGKIDALVEAQRRLIELLKEKRQAVISHAVTKGLDPAAPMKDSGVEWLGKVPTHWDVVQVRRAVSRLEQGWSPECLSRPAEDGEWGVLKTGCVNGGFYRDTENKALPLDLIARDEYEVRDGDVLMSRASGSPQLIGSVARVSGTQGKVLLSDKIFRLHLEPAIDADFFVMTMASSPARSQIVNAISGAEGMANNLPQSRIKEFWIALPPKADQEAIVRSVSASIGRIDSLAVQAEAAIDLLQERRAALISAAVTGKIDVRGLAPKQAEAA